MPQLVPARRMQRNTSTARLGAGEELEVAVVPEEPVPTLASDFAKDVDRFQVAHQSGRGGLGNAQSSFDHVRGDNGLAER